MARTDPVVILTTETKVQILPATGKSKPITKSTTKKVRAVVTTKTKASKPEPPKKAAPKAAPKPSRAPKRVAKDPRAPASLKGANEKVSVRGKAAPGREEMALS